MIGLREGYPFPPFDQIDTWFYSGFMWNPSEWNALFPSTYYGARVSWLYPGAILHNIFPPLAANIALKMSFSAMLAWAWGFIGWREGGWSVATIGIWLAVFLPQIIIAMHGDYTDTAFLTYASLAIALFYGANSAKRPTLWMIAGSVSLTLMGIANLGTLAFLGLGIVTFHLLWLPASFATQARRLAIYLGTAALTIGGLQAIHSSLGGNEFLLAPQIRLSSTLHSQGTSNEWFIPGWDWMLCPTWLIIPITAMFWGVVYLLFDRGWLARKNLTIRSLLAALAMAFMVGGYLQLRGSMVLGLTYYAIGYLSISIPLILALVGRHQVSAKHAPFWVVGTGCVMAFISLVPLPITYNEQFRWLRNLAGSSGAYIWVGWLIASGTALAVLMVRQRFALTKFIHPATYLVAISFLSLPRTAPHYSYGDRLSHRYAAVYDATQYLSESFDQKPLFWVDPEFDDAWSLASAHLWGYSLYTLEAFPQLSDPRLVTNPIVIAVEPESGQKALDLARDRLGRSGFSINDLELKEIRKDSNIGFDILAFHIGLLPIDPADPPKDMKPLQMIAGLEYSGPNSYLNELGFFNHNGGHVSTEIVGHTPTFNRTTPIDYAFTHWRTLPDTGHSRHLIFEFYFNSGKHTRVALEDEYSRQFHAMDFSEPGRHLEQVALPNDSKFFRFLFYSPTDESAPLPTNIIIHEVKK